MAFVAVGRTTRVGLAHWGPSRAFRATMASRRNLSSYLVSPKELQDALKKNPPSPISPDPRVIPLCASWFLPNDERTGIQTFREQRIPKARFFDLDKVIDKRSPYPHMLPDAKRFAAAMSELGIRKEDVVVVYDTKELGIFSAPRVGWTLKVFGHQNVHILNNFRLWVEEGLPTESGELYSVECCPYPIPEFDASKVASFEDVKEVAQDHNKEGAEGIQVLDARPSGRFTGKDLSLGRVCPLDTCRDPSVSPSVSCWTPKRRLSSPLISCGPSSRRRAWTRRSPSSPAAARA